MTATSAAKCPCGPNDFRTARVTGAIVYVTRSADGARRYSGPKAGRVTLSRRGRWVTRTSAAPGQRWTLRAVTGRYRLSARSDHARCAARTVTLRNEHTSVVNVYCRPA